MASHENPDPQFPPHVPQPPNPQNPTPGVRDQEGRGPNDPNNPNNQNPNNDPNFRNNPNSPGPGFQNSDQVHDGRRSNPDFRNGNPDFRNDANGRNDENNSRLRRDTRPFDAGRTRDRVGRVEIGDNVKVIRNGRLTGGRVEAILGKEGVINLTIDGATELTHVQHSSSGKDDCWYFNDRDEITEAFLEIQY